MSKTFKHIKLRKLKTAYVERKNLLSNRTDGDMCTPVDVLFDPELRKTGDEFGRSGKRYGNKRKSVAKDKVRERRRTRKKLKEEE